MDCSIKTTNFFRSPSDSKLRRKKLFETGELADCKIIVSKNPLELMQLYDRGQIEDSAVKNEHAYNTNRNDMSDIASSMSALSLGKHVPNVEECVPEDIATGNSSSGDMDDVVFLCHKMVLATASEVFERMFFGDFEGEVRIIDIEPEVFKEFLKYIYTYEIDADIVTASNLKELIYVAEKYMVDDFTYACIEILKKKPWDLADIIPIYEIACFYENMSLLLLSNEKICTNGAALLDHWTFYELKVSYLKRLIVLLIQYNKLKANALLNALERYESNNPETFTVGRPQNSSQIFAWMMLCEAAVSLKLHIVNATQKTKYDNYIDRLMAQVNNVLDAEEWDTE